MSSRPLAYCCLGCPHHGGWRAGCVLLIRCMRVSSAPVDGHWQQTCPGALGQPATPGLSQPRGPSAPSAIVARRVSRAASLRLLETSCCPMAASPSEVHKRAPCTPSGFIHIPCVSCAHLQEILRATPRPDLRGWHASWQPTPAELTLLPSPGLQPVVDENVGHPRRVRRQPTKPEPPRWRCSNTQAIRWHMACLRQLKRTPYDQP